MRVLRHVAAGLLLGALAGFVLSLIRPRRTFTYAEHPPADVLAAAQGGAVG